MDDFGVGDVGELGALLGEAADEISQGLVGSLSAPLEIPKVPRAHVCALEVAHEGPDQVVPVVDLACRQVLEPRSCGVCKVQRKVAEDYDVVGRAAQLAGQAVVVEPKPGIGLSQVFGESGGLPKAPGKWSSADLPAEHTGARRLR